MPLPEAEAVEPMPVPQMSLPSTPGDAAAPEEGVLIAPVIWQEELPVKGTQVKFRVRGSALMELINTGSDWCVTADGKLQPARIVWPVKTPTVPSTKLEFSAAEDSGKLIATIDLGETPPQLNELLLEFTNQELTAKVAIAVSSDGKSYSSYSDAQLIYQRITPTGFIRINSITCNPEDCRYLKLQITSNTSAQLVSINSRNVQEDMNDHYEVAARFGASLSDPETHERLLPVELASNLLPISQIRLTAAPHEPVAVKVVRLNPAGGVKRTTADSVWGGKLEAFGISRDASKLACFDPNSGVEPWAIALPAGGTPILEFDEVRAWAAEVYVVTSMPEHGCDLSLKLNAAPRSVPDMPTIRVAALKSVPLAGEFNGVQSPPPPLGLTGPSAQMIERFTGEADRLKYALGYGALGLICVLVGLIALRRRNVPAKGDS